MTDPAFWTRGYSVAEDLIGPDQIAFTRAAMDASRRRGTLEAGVNRVLPQAAFNEYSPIGGEILLLQCRPAIEAVVGRGLIPAYAFWRIYERGAALLRHKDRSSCEISATLTIHAAPAGELWPIHVTGLDGETAALALPPGSAAIYQGCEVPHWREALAGEMQYQVFLHYVLADGPNAAFAFDGRESLQFQHRAPAEG